MTVVIPAFNEKRWIGACIKALMLQTYPKDRYEVIFVDNGSSDNTRELLQSAGAHLMHESKRSAFAARNVAIQNTNSDWLAFTDADCLADKFWLEELWNCAEKTEANLVSGLTLYSIVKDNFGNRLLAENHTPVVLQDAIENHQAVASGNMFVSRRLFNELGLFKELKSGSDIEFSRRVFNAGYHIAFTPDAKVRHQCDLSNMDYLYRTFETRYGQTIHKNVFGRREFLRNFRNIPWRPGLGAVNPQHESNLPFGKFIALWLFRWLNRWMDYLGTQWALTETLVQRPDKRHQRDVPN